MTDDFTADDILRMTDPIRLEIRADGDDTYTHTTGAMWLNLFCTRCDQRLRGITPPSRGPVARARWCRQCHITWVLLVTPRGTHHADAALRVYEVQWRPLLPSEAND